MGRSPCPLPQNDPRNHNFLCEQYCFSTTSSRGRRQAESLWQGSCHFIVRYVLRGNLFFFSLLIHNTREGPTSPRSGVITPSPEL